MSHKQEPDVTLLLEGTYPFVTGGVSSWVHQIISGLPELRFSLVFLGSQKAQYGEPKYRLPANVTSLACHYLMESAPKTSPRPRRCPGRAGLLSDSTRLHDSLRQPGGLPDAVAGELLSAVGQPGGFTREEFLFSEAAWQQICESYSRLCTDPSFVDYFWTVRTMHGPIFTLAQIARDLPPSRVYHSVSSGYAGLLGALLQRRHGRPFVLTEHGIYTKERAIDLTQADWIRDAPEAPGGLRQELGYLRQLWIRFFQGLGRLAYATADPIIALYEGNRQRQIADGADPARTHVIPNGVDLTRFTPLLQRRPARTPPVLGLVGRVVPIKDIRTFIRALQTVCSRVPDAEGWIIGPLDEDPDYARECRDLVSGLGLQGRIKLLGLQRVEEILPQLGLMVLTSISEALPLVLLEGFASGLPAVATDVGACRELIEGRGPADRALGSAGAVVSIADPEAVADAALSLLRDPTRWGAAQQAGLARVRRYYDQRLLLESYRGVYQEALNGREASAPGLPTQGGARWSAPAAAAERGGHGGHRV